jgi:adenosylhomocysteine nucleosidase
VIRLGILAGLKSEAACLAAGTIPRSIELSGAHLAGAIAARDRLIAAGATHLVSFGLAGGLDPALAPGTLLLPNVLIAPDETHEIDADWHGRVAAALGGMKPMIGAHLGSDQPLGSVAAKREAFETTGAFAVDMESHVLAGCGKPFLILRVVCDGADDTLPPAALIGVRPDGGTALGAILGSVLRAPGQIPALMRLGAASAAAHRALGEAGRHLLDFGLGLEPEQ